MNYDNVKKYRQEKSTQTKKLAKQTTEVSVTTLRREIVGFLTVKGRKTVIKHVKKKVLKSSVFGEILSFPEIWIHKIFKVK